MRRRPARSIAAALPLLLLLLAAGCGEGARRAPEAFGLEADASGWNLFLLSLDTVRADRLGAYGYQVHPTSPHLDALMGRGVRFARATAPRAATWPSLASVLTGLYPSGHGVIKNGYSFPEDVPTLPLILQAAGYRTGAFLSNMCRAGHRGWEERFCARGVDGRVSQAALEWLDGLDGEAPFFLWTHYFAAHPPYYNGGREAERLDPGYEGPVAPRKGVLDRIMTEPIPLDAADVRHLDAVYDAAVMGTDDLVGRLLRALEMRGLLERTLVVLLADHGEDLYDHHGYLYHACSVYETGLHVPLAMVAPGLLPEGTAVEPPVELLDVAPTVLELLGLPVPEVVHGKSLVPYLERPGALGPGRPTFSEYGDTRIHTVLHDGWKLVNNPGEHTPLCFEDAPPDLYPIARTELYRLPDDPLEQHDLSGEEPGRVAELRTLLEARFRSLEARAGEQEIPEDLKEELRALGYVAD